MLVLFLTGMECFHVYCLVNVINYAFLIGIFGSVGWSKKSLFFCLIYSVSNICYCSNNVWDIMLSKSMRLSDSYRLYVADEGFLNIN